MAEPNYGLDLSCTTDLDPLLRTVSGTTLMEQVCLRRLYVRKGGLLSNPNDETLDARDFIGQGITAADIPRIQGQCQNVLEADERIYSATVEASFDFYSQTLTLAITGLGASGPFNLTLSITALTVELLRPQ